MRSSNLGNSSFGQGCDSELASFAKRLLSVIKDQFKSGPMRRGGSLNERLSRGNCGVIDQLYGTNDVPFGAQEEENRLVKPIAVGLVAIVAVLLCIGIAVSLSGGISPSFSIASSASSNRNSLDDTNAEAGNDNGDGGFAVMSSSAGSSNTSEELIYVHIIGCVVSPGVYSVPKSARLIEVVQAAGGLTSEAAQDALNLARELTDGEQIRVYSQEEVENGVASASSSGVAGSTSGTTGSSTTNSQSGQSQTSGIDSNGRVNINSATTDELQTVSGIGPSIAAKIVAEREANGPFSSVDDLTRVSGIGDKKLAAFRDSLTV